MNLAPRGCKTCQARKVRCDRSLPSCTRCIKSGIACRGYQLRLSWPKGDNHRRALTVSPVTSTSRSGKYAFVQSTVWDMELYHGFMEGWTVTEKARSALKHFFTPPGGWVPHKLGGTNAQLLQYFKLTAFRSLTSLGVNPSVLRDTLLRMAFSSGTPASQALLHSLLAFSSLHRHGPQSQALQHKVGALSKLSESITRGVQGEEALQHSAASMVLCAFEVQQQADGCQYWTWYVCGSRDMLNRAIGDRPSLRDGDSAALVNWVHYYDVLARFSSRHWHWPKALLGEEVDRRNRAIYESPAAKVPFPASPSHEVLQLVAEVVESVASPSNPKYETDEYWTHVETLRKQLKDAVVVSEALTEVEKSSIDITKLYQLAAQIYLERASTERNIQSEKIKTWLEEAFDILGRLRTCPWPLPLFIVGCEAHTDERRLAIMELVFRTENESHMKHLGCLRNLLRVSWTQDDLAHRNMSYIDRMTRIMSLSDTAPILV